MHLEWAILADELTERPGKVDIIGAGVDRLTGPFLPIMNPLIWLTFRVRLTRAEAEAEAGHTWTVEIIDPDGQQIQPPLEIEVETRGITPPSETEWGDVAFVASGQILQGIAFKSFGRHEVIIGWDGKEVARLPLQIVEGVPSG